VRNKGEFLQPLPSLNASWPLLEKFVVWYVFVVCVEIRETEMGAWLRCGAPGRGHFSHPICTYILASVSIHLDPFLGFTFVWGHKKLKNNLQTIPTGCRVFWLLL